METRKKYRKAKKRGEKQEKLPLPSHEKEARGVLIIFSNPYKPTILLRSRDISDADDEGSQDTAYGQSPLRWQGLDKGRESLDDASIASSAYFYRRNPLSSDVFEDVNQSWAYHKACHKTNDNPQHLIILVPLSRYFCNNIY